MSDMSDSTSFLHADAGNHPAGHRLEYPLEPVAHLRSVRASRPVPQCEDCALRRSLCLASSLDDDIVTVLHDVVQTWRSVGRGTRLFRAGDPFHSVYVVRSGSFKSVMMQPNGRDHVTGFHLAGEMLGLDGICTERHACEAVALDDASVCVIPFPALEALCRQVRPLQQTVHRLLSAEIVRESSLMLLLGDMTAEQRLAAFLLNIGQRMRERGYSGTELRLRMTRADIGSYLGMTLETVSRTFSRFQQDGLISVSGKHVVLSDEDGLREL